MIPKYRSVLEAAMGLSATLAPWLQALDEAQCLSKGEARGFGLASLHWTRSSAQEQWLRLKIGVETGVDNARVVEFLLLLEKLLACDRRECERLLAQWINGYAGYGRSRYTDCCMGRCESATRSPDPRPLSVVNPCCLHSDAWISDIDGNRGDFGVVIESTGDVDAPFFALLETAKANPFSTPTLSCEFRSTYRELEDRASTTISTDPVLRLHVRLKAQELDKASAHHLAQWIQVWATQNKDAMTVVGVDMRSKVLQDTIAAAVCLPFQHLLVCAAPSASGYCYSPPSQRCDPLDDTIVRNIITKSQRYLQELELCNVSLASFACLTNGLSVGGCRLQKLRLRDFAMSVTSDGGVFAALKDTTHPLYHTLDELEISQSQDSVGGLSFWLEREAGAMLLANSRLARCVIHQSCVLQPASANRGFRQSRGRELHISLPLSSKLAFLSGVPIQLPRVLSAHIMELAGHRTTRVAEMHYQIVDAAKISLYVDDCKAWTRSHTSHSSTLPYGSYYF